MVKKGITPVISVVLLIMLVVAITGGAYYWMTNVQGSMQERVGSSIQESSEMSTASFSIVSAVCNGTSDFVNLTALNTGQSSLDTGNSIVTVSSIQGSVLGTDTTVTESPDPASAGASFTVDAPAAGSTAQWDMTSGDSYSVRLNIGSASQTATCTAS